MYCPHCGKEIDEGMTFCPNCGKQVKKAPQSPELDEVDEFFKVSPPPAQSMPEQQRTVRVKRVNVLAAVGFALSMFGFLFGSASWIGIIFTILISVAGIVCSSLGLVQCKRNGASGKGLAIAGIVLGAVGIVLNIIATVIVYLFPEILAWLLGPFYNLLGSNPDGGNYY